jgi:hypothetical protein
MDLEWPFLILALCLLFIKITLIVWASQKLFMNYGFLAPYHIFPGDCVKSVYTI